MLNLRHGDDQNLKRLSLQLNDEKQHSHELLHHDDLVDVLENVVEEIHRVTMTKKMNFLLLMIKEQMLMNLIQKDGMIIQNQDDDEKQLLHEKINNVLDDLNDDEGDADDEVVEGDDDEAEVNDDEVVETNNSLQKFSVLTDQIMIKIRLLIVMMMTVQKIQCAWIKNDQNENEVNDNDKVQDNDDEKDEGDEDDVHDEVVHEEDEIETEM